MVKTCLSSLKEEDEDKTICWERLNCAGNKRNCCIKSILAGMGVSKEDFVETLGEQFGDCRFVAPLSEVITRHGGGAAFTRVKEGRSGLVFDIARRQGSIVSSSEVVGSAWGLVLVCGLHVPGPYLTVLRSYWILHVWNRKEPLFFSLVSQYCGLSILFTSDVKCSALVSSLGCIGTLMVSLVSG